MKIENVFLATKTLISIDADPLGEKSRNGATQTKKHEILRTWL